MTLNGYENSLVYHLKPGQGEVAQRPRLKQLVLVLEVHDLDVVVEDDGLRVLDVAERRHVEHHPRHVVRVTPHLAVTDIE